jgi:hypothetical protein
MGGQQEYNVQNIGVSGAAYNGEYNTRRYRIGLKSRRVWYITTKVGD